MGNGSSNPDNYYMCVNFIGESMENLLNCISKQFESSYAAQRNNKVSLYDYWDYIYYQDLDFYGQLAITMDKFIVKKDTLDLNCRECLIVRTTDIHSPIICHVLDKVNNIRREQYMPLILFLCDFFNEEELTKNNIIDDSRYPQMDKRMIFFEKFEDGMGFNEEKIEKIKYRLERFCSYHNQLGDRFSVGIKEHLIDYDLTERNFPFTVNICCIGRFGKGKSTGTNCILGEKKALENRSGTSATTKINFYQVSKFPLKIFDLPGFENKETVLNAVKQFKILNEEIHKLQDQIHVILYFIKSTDERMFSEMEYDMFNQIILHKDAFVIYVLTHSSIKTDREEIYDMINTGIKGVLSQNLRKMKNKNKIELLKEKCQNISLKMEASSNNCVFVNFHKTNKLPIYGIPDLFEKIAYFVELTEAYRYFNKNNYSSKEEFEKKIIEEAKIRKIRARDVLLKHKIGSAIAGIFPGADLIMRNYVIKKDAARKAGEIFGFDIKNITEQLKKQEIRRTLRELKESESETELYTEKDEISSNNFITPNGNKERGSIHLEEYTEDKNEEDLKENPEEKKKINKEKKIKYGGFALSAVTGTVSFSTSLARYALSVGGIGLIAVSLSFSLVGTILGAGLGGYFMYSHCEKLLEQFEVLFINNADSLSDSLLLGVNYLKIMGKLYENIIKEGK